MIAALLGVAFLVLAYELTLVAAVSMVALRRQMAGRSEARAISELLEVGATTGPPVRLRASDRERQAAVDRLCCGIADGRLSLDEGVERIGQAYEALYRTQLFSLVADLPSESAGRASMAAHVRAAVPTAGCDFG